MTDHGDGRVPAGGGPLVYVEDLSAPLLAPADHHHLARVRRLRDGDPLIVGDGAGRWRPARFHDRTPELAGDPVEEPAALPELGVAFALTKGTKPELAVQKLTEVGVDRICPFTAGRSVVRWDHARADRALERLATVARQAAMQSRRARPPVVEPVVDYPEVAGRAGACRADRGGAPPILAHPLVLVGPEGGWDADELAVDLPTVALGTGVLRAETAAITAGALLVALRAGLVVPAG